MKNNRFSLRALIILSLAGILLINTLVMIYFIVSFDFQEVAGKDIVENPYLWLGVFMVLVILFFMTLIIIINKAIFEPIFAMKRAAEHIKSGNLNYPIVYDAENEIGDFCREFDKMRIRLKDTIQEQHEIEKRRKRLIASITHDLRTPLTSIKGYVEAIQDGIVKDQETYEKYLETISDKADYLNHLIDDLSVYTKQELGEFTLNRERLNSGRLLNSYFDHKTEDFRELPLTLVLHKPFISTFIKVDPYRFNQILENLISNAQKYANKLIEVRTRVVNYHLQIIISDDGDGIPEDVISNIFDPFFMVNKVKDQKEKGGSGLGLAIVKQLTERHEGTISVESTIGKGTTFTVDFPLDL